MRNPRRSPRQHRRLARGVVVPLPAQEPSKDLLRIDLTADHADPLERRRDYRAQRILPQVAWWSEQACLIGAFCAPPARFTLRGMRYELSEGTSHKFWEVSRDGSEVTVRYGRIGTDGTTLTKKHASPDAAQREHDKLVKEKTRKGYRLVGSKEATKTAKAKPGSSTKPAANKRPVDRRIGRVINGYSNSLVVLVADATLAATYSGPVNDPVEEDGRKKKQKRPPPDDYERAIKAIDKKEYAIGSGTGVVVQIGGCGVADVLRLGDALVIPETYTDEDDVDLEATRDQIVATHPTTKPKLIGTVDVKSGVLVLMGIWERGPKLDLAGVAKRGAVKTDCGVAVAVKPGRYDVWREEFANEPSGDWGCMPSRVRVVPAGTTLAAGAPVVAVAPVGPAHQSTPGGQRRLVDPKDKWEAVASIAIAEDGRIFAGENGRHGVAAWDAGGKLLWQRSIRPQPKKADYLLSVKVVLGGNDVVALCRHTSELVVLDARTGKEKRKLKLADPRGLLIAGDRLIVRTGITTTVLAFPSLEKLTELEEYVNGSGIAVSRDGKHLAVHGHEWHTYDLKTLRHVRTVDVGDDPYDVAFTPDGALITVDGSSRIKLWDPRTGKRVALIDGAKERNRKPAANAVDSSARHLAIARDDGTVAVIDSKTKKTIHLFEKHLVAIPGTGATELSGLAFTKDGKTLWVSAGPKGTPVGLTAYSLVG